MKRYLGAILLLLSLSACFPGRTAAPARKKNEKIQAMAGRTIAGVGLTIDADYEPRLDNVIAGYKLLPVVMKNTSLRNIPMIDKLDRWVIVGEHGQKFKAVNSLRHKDPRAWREIPERMRNLIDYPEILPINYSVTFDLLMPEKANLEYFKEIHYFNAAMNQEFILEKEY